MENHNLFKPKTLDEGRNCVVGSCNGYTMKERWELETPLFAYEIAKQIPREGKVIAESAGWLKLFWTYGKMLLFMG